MVRHARAEIITHTAQVAGRSVHAPQCLNVSGHPAAGDAEVRIYDLSLTVPQNRAARLGHGASKRRRVSPPSFPVNRDVTLAMRDAAKIEALFGVTTLVP